MSKSVLVVTPQVTFGDMLRVGLEETGIYRVFIASDEPSALVQLKSEGCQLAFLDVDLGMEAVAEIGRALRSLAPDLGLVIVSDEDLPPALDALRPWTLLRKPFYLPELIGMLRPDSGEEPDAVKAAPVAASPAPDNLLWLQDVNKAAQRLTRLTLESSAQAALITRGMKLWAYAGGLAQESANELVGIITRKWHEQKGGDLLRFTRLETTRAEHMLYATSLGEDAILALVFDAETPFGTIRAQANSLARSLAVEKTGPLPPLSVDSASRGGIVESSSVRPALKERSLESVSGEAAAKSRVEESVPSAAEVDFPDFPSISEIIVDIPTPIPASEMSVQADAPVKPVSPVKKGNADHSVLETRPSTPLAETHVISRESSPPVPLRDLMVGEMDETVKHEVEELEVTAPSKVNRPATPVRAPQLGELDETRPHSVTEVAGRVILEPASSGLYHLNYACLLVPRFSAHYLTGDLADRLGEWLPHICVAFGWRLEFLALRPEYMQWVVSVPPNTSPGYLMRIMRQQTSEKIFANFPRLKKENPSGDFWAPGYLIMGGSQPHPQQLIKDYIKQTRQRQGASQPRK